jgi:hypothetical protein
VFWVISVYFNIRNTLPKSRTFLLGHPVYMFVHWFVEIRTIIDTRYMHLNNRDFGVST